MKTSTTASNIGPLRFSDYGCGEAYESGIYSDGTFRTHASRGTSSSWKWIGEKGEPLSPDAVNALESRVTERRSVCG